MLLTFGVVLRYAAFDVMPVRVQSWVILRP